MDGQPARPVVQLQLQAQPDVPSAAAGDVLRYADTRTDRLADRFSADREMTWRLARANGLAAAGVGVVLGLSYLGIVGAGRLDTLGALGPLIGLAVPGWVLLAALAGIRAGRRGPVIAALAAGAWLGCAWAATAVGVLFVGYRSRSVAAYVTPAIVAATLLIPAGILVYHAVRVLAVGGRGGQRDQTSGLNVAVPATDQDLWRFIGRILMLRLAGGVGLFLVGVACVAATRMRPAPRAPILPAATPFSGDFYTRDGLPGDERQAVLDLLDRRGWMGARRRQVLDDLLRQAGRRLELERVNFAWEQFAAVERKPSGASVDAVEAAWSMDGSVSILWFRDGRVVIASGRYVPGIYGDAFVGFENNRTRRWIWSHAAIERWAARHIEAGNAAPSREQLVALLEVLPPPSEDPNTYTAAPRPGPKLPAFEAQTLPDRTLLVTLPGDDPLYIDAAGTADKRTPQERAAEAAAEPPPPAYFPVSWAWPLPLAVIGLCEIVAALAALSRSRPGRSGTPVPLTADVALRLVAPQAALGIAAAVALAVVAYAAYDVEIVRKRDFFNAQFTVIMIAIGGWIFWTALALPRRAVALAGAPR